MTAGGDRTRTCSTYLARGPKPKCAGASVPLDWVVRAFSATPRGRLRLDSIQPERPAAISGGIEVAGNADRLEFEFRHAPEIIRW
jgi:hypothetical protein